MNKKDLEERLDWQRGDIEELGKEIEKIKWEYLGYEWYLDTPTYSVSEKLDLLFDYLGVEIKPITTAKPKLTKRRKK